MTTEYAHVHPSCHELFKLNEFDRMLACARDFWIQHSDAEDLISRINMMIRMRNKTVAPSTLVIAPGGGGKSSLVNEMKKRNTSADHKMIFVTMHQTPNGYSLKHQILIAMGLDVSRRTRQTINISHEMRYIIQSQNICAIVIDEIHDALTLPPTEQNINLSLLKNLSGDEYGLSVIAFGVPKAERALRSDPQLERRFSVQTLKPWKTNNAARNFIASYIHRLPLKVPTDIKDDSLHTKIITKGQGLTDNIVKIIQCSAMAAVLDKSEHITHYHLDNIEEIMEKFCMSLRYVADEEVAQ